MTEKERISLDHGDRDSALVPTKQLEHFRIPEGQPDPRGWSVKTADGTTLGKVEDMLFDTIAERVRYLEVKADGDLTRHGGRDFFLLPVGTARLDDEHDDVVVSIDAARLAGVPAYERGRLSREYETSLRDFVRDRPDASRTDASRTDASRTATGPGMGRAAIDRDANFYGSPEYDDERFFSRGRRGDTERRY